MKQAARLEQMHDDLDKANFSRMQRDGLLWSVCQRSTFQSSHCMLKLIGNSLTKVEDVRSGLCRLSGEAE